MSSEEQDGAPAPIGDAGTEKVLGALAPIIFVAVAIVAVPIALFFAFLVLYLVVFGIGYLVDLAL